MSVRSTGLAALLAAALAAVAALAGTATAAEADPFTAPFVFVATGSGVLISADGEILTNNHVIADSCSPLSPKLTVRLAASGEASARLVATDPVGDLALLRLDPPRAVPAFARLVDAIPPAGTPVVAVGNPFALGDLDDLPSLSRGVLSTGRVVRQSYVDCLQHDAAANPGNSGGPLFTVAGRLLGITGAIRSRSGFRINSGIGLALSATAIARFLPALRSAPGGWVLRSAPPAALELVRDGRGVVVTAAGEPLQAGDVLLAVDGRPCPSVDTALGLFRGLPWTPGATMAVRVRRAGGEQELAVPVERSPIPGRPWSGLALGERDGRVVAERVDGGSPAALAGVLADDTVLTAQGVPLVTRLDALRVTAPLGIGDRLELRVRTADGPERTVACWIAPQPDGN